MPLPAHGGHDDLGRFRPLADINVTPLVDVMLVLLIIFMVTAPMLAAGLNINLPKASSAQSLAPKDPVMITVTRDNKYLIGQEELAASALANAVRVRMKDDAQRAVYIQGDRETVYGNMIAVVDLLAAAGFSKIVMVVERKNSSAASGAR